MDQSTPVSPSPESSLEEMWANAQAAPEGAPPISEEEESDEEVASEVEAEPSEEEESAEEEETEEEGEEEKEEKPAEKPEKKVTISVKGKDGKLSQVEVPQDAIVTVTVNGKPEKVTIQQAINDYSGKQWIKGRAIELSRAERQLQEQQTQLKQIEPQVKAALAREEKLLSDLKTSLQRKDAIGTVRLLTSLVPDVEEFEVDQMLLEQFTPIVDAWSRLSDADKARIQADARAEAARRKLDALTTKQKSSEQESAIAQQIQAAVTERELTTQDFTLALNELEELVQKGRYAKEQVTVENVAHYAALRKQETVVKGILEEDFPEHLSNSELLQEVTMLSARQKKPWDSAQIRNFLAEALGATRVEKLAAAKAPKKPTGKEGTKKKSELPILNSKDLNRIWD